MSIASPPVLDINSSSILNKSNIKTHSRRIDRCLVLILFLSLILNTIGMTWGLPNYVDRAQDSVALMTLKGMPTAFSNGWRSRYPPMHLLTLATCYTPYLGYLMLSGQLQEPTRFFPYGLADPLTLLTHLIFMARLVSVLMGVGIVLGVFLAVRELYDRRAALCASLIVTLYYPLVFYAHNANTDVPYLFWATLSIYHFIKVLKYRQLKNYILYAVFGALAICTKDQAFALILLAPLPMLWTQFAEQRRETGQIWPSIVQALFDRRLLLAGLASVVTFILAQNLLFNFDGFVAHVTMLLGPKWQSYATHTPTLFDRLQLLWETTSHLINGLTPPLFGICLVGTVYCAWRFPKYSLPVLLLPTGYYVLFINKILWTANRHTLPIGMILAFFGGKLLADLWQQTRWQGLTRAAVCGVLAYVALFPIQLDYLLLRGSHERAEQWMQAHLPKGAIIETLAFDHQHLNWAYPRFPAWVKVRYSRAKTPTMWESAPILAKHVRLPNLYRGAEAADYIIVGENKSEDVALQHQPVKTTRDQIIQNLFAERLGYTLVATFKAPTIVPIRYLPVNQTLYIFERKRELSVKAGVVSQ